MKKKATAILIAILLMLPTVPLIKAADISWAEQETDALQGKGIRAEQILPGAQGTPKELLETHLNKPMTRGETVFCLVNLFAIGQTVNQQPYFSDVTPDMPIYAAVGAAFEKGYVKGEGDGTFLPDTPISREDTSVILARILNCETPGELPFTDAEQIAPYSRDAVCALTENGIINGYPDGTFQPQNPVTLGELLVLTSRALQWQEQQTGLPAVSPTPSPSSSPGVVHLPDGNTSSSHGSSGSGSTHHTGADRTPPEIDYTISTTDLTDERVIVNLAVTDSRSIQALKWARPYELIYNADHSGYDPSKTYARTLEQHPERIQDLDDSRLEIKENGYYLIYAEDTSGNAGYEMFEITNIQAPELELQTVIDEESETVTLKIRITAENKNAPVNKIGIRSEPPLSAGGAASLNTNERVSGGAASLNTNERVSAGLEETRKDIVMLEVQPEMGFTVPFDNEFEVLAEDEWGNTALVRKRIENVPPQFTVTVLPDGSGDNGVTLEMENLPEPWYSNGMLTVSCRRVTKGLEEPYTAFELFQTQESSDSVETAKPITQNGRYVIALQYDGAYRRASAKEITVNNITVPSALVTAGEPDREGNTEITLSDYSGNANAELSRKFYCTNTEIQAIKEQHLLGEQDTNAIAQYLSGAVDKEQYFAEDSIKIQLQPQEEYYIVLTDTWGNSSFLPVKPSPAVGS